MRKLGALGIALVALLSLVNAVGLMSLPIYAALANLGRFPKAGALFLSVLPVATAIAAGVFLLLRRERLAESWLPQSESIPDMATNDVVHVAALLLGLYLVIHVIPVMISQFATPVLSIAQERAQGFIPAAAITQQLIGAVPPFLASLATLVLGWFLLARSESLTRRLVGTPPTAGDGAGTAPLPVCPSCGAPYDPADYEGGLSEPLCAECKSPLGIPRA